jgi:8-oxo-dGTP pyrophosphatase MutT (NUDIX family)
MSFPRQEFGNPELSLAGGSRSTVARRPGILDRLLRAPLRAIHGLLRLNWFFRRPRTFGAHALALTPQGKVILVRLRYAPGWRLPGGGRDEHEDPREAVLRELREEIGMTSHGSVRLAAELEESTDFKRDLASLLVVRDVEYRPKRWSWEVEAIMEAGMDDLPKGLSPRTRDWLEAVRSKL